VIGPRRMLKRIYNAWMVLLGKKGAVTVSAVLIHADGTKEDLGNLGNTASVMEAASGGEPEIHPFDFSE